MKFLLFSNNFTFTSQAEKNNNRSILIKFRFLFFILLFILCTQTYTAETTKIENFIYSIHAFDGYSYKKTFCREGSGIIYFLEHYSNILSTRKSFIYYWPLFGRYRLDTASLNYPINGKLEIRGNSIKTILLEPVLYTYTNIPEKQEESQTPAARSGREFRESYAENLRVLQGDEAVETAEYYESLMEEFRIAELEWEKKIKKYDEWKKMMVEKIRKARKEGKEVAGLVEEVQSNQLFYWMGPQRPNYFIMPLSQAFIINLPKGEYHIRLIDNTGSIVEGSEKKMIIFSKIRSEGVLFNYSTADKITKPRESKVPFSTLYFDGSSDLFVQPFLQDEYNEFYHERLMINEARAHKHKTKWEKTKRLDNTWMEIKKGSQNKEIILEDIFYVDQNIQTRGGYEIVYWDNRPDEPHEYVDPSFRAFRITLNKSPQVIDIRLKAFHGNDIKMSKRQIRIVRKSGFIVIVLILSFSPLIGLGYMLFRRQKLYKKVSIPYNQR